VTLDKEWSREGGASRGGAEPIAGLHRTELKAESSLSSRFVAAVVVQGNMLVLS
jgi:hypothetical protein